MMQSLRMRVGPSWDGVRLDRFLRLSLPALPGRSVAFAIGSGNVSVGGVRAAKGRVVRQGEEVAIRRIPEEDIEGTLALYEQLLQESEQDLMAADVRGEVDATTERS